MTSSIRRSVVLPVWDRAIDWLGRARGGTELLRRSDDWSYPLLRKALLANDLDPGATCLAQFFPDGGSDFGVLIGPDGISRTVDVWWNSDHVEICPLPDDPAAASAFALDLYGAWQLFNEEGRGPKDPVDALLPYIRWRTRDLREPNRVPSGTYNRIRNWSLLYSLLEEEDADPGVTVAMHPTKSFPYPSMATRFGFLLPDGRVFVLSAETDRERNPVSVVEWDEIPPRQVRSKCGPLYEAALRVQQAERA